MVNRTREDRLHESLYDALKAFNFPGHYYYFSKDSGAPNPGLQVAGLGTVAIPLAEGVVESLASLATEIPSEQTVAEGQPCTTWEIDPKKVSFTNPAWKTFVDELAVKTLAPALGLPTKAKPRCEFQRLVVWKEGGSPSSLPAGGKKPARKFATVLVILPSSYEGGDIQLDHSGQTATLHHSSGAGFKTPVVAWYDTATVEFKPITSGFRAALCYDLIHASTKTPLPALPDTKKAVAQLRLPLQKWKNGEYDCLPDSHLLAHVLSCRYTSNDLEHGLDAMKGNDAHLISHLLPVAKESGFAVCVANIDLTISGVSGGRHGIDESESDGKVSSLTRIGGKLAMDLGQFSIHLEYFLPDEDVFESYSADDYDSEEDYDYDSDTVSYTKKYYRSLLILFQEKDEAAVILALKGPDWAMKKLDKSKVPTAMADTLVSAALENLNDPEDNYKYARDLKARNAPPTTARLIMRYAVVRNRPDLWNSASGHIGPREKDDIVQKMVVRALNKFGLEALKPGLNKLVMLRPTPKYRQLVLQAIRTGLKGAADVEWAQELARSANVTWEEIGTYTPAEVVAAKPSSGVKRKRQE